MIKNKINLTKASWLILLYVGIILFSPNYSQATVIPIDVNGILYAGPSAGTPYYTQYWLDTVQLGILDAFCVEDAYANSSISYELVNVIPGGLTTAAGIASRYFDGSVLALSSINNQTEAKVATQLAIWQNLGIATTSDPYYSPLVSDIFYYLDFSSILDSIWLAESPADGYAGGSSGKSQDYLVSVPDADIMWLLGPAFIMLGLLGRKKSNYKRKKII